MKMRGTNEIVWIEKNAEKKERRKEKKSTFLMNIGCYRKTFRQTKCCFQGYADF